MTTKRKPPSTAWKRGKSGNPAGKKPGTRNHVTVFAHALLEKDAEKVVAKVVSAALAGNLAAARLVLERVIPPARERPISLDLRCDLRTAADVNELTAGILLAACEGRVTPGEAHALAAIAETRRRAIETEDLERRIATLEARP